jgi:hypothetical protein
VYYPFSAIIALFITIMRNPRQPTAKVDLRLITAATRLFDKICIRSDLADKMNALTSRFEREATIALESLSNKNQESKLIDKTSAVAFNTSSYSINLYEGDTNHIGTGKIPENHGKRIIDMMTAFGSNANNAVCPRGNTSQQPRNNMVLPFGWSDLDHVATNVGGGDDMEFQPSSSYSLQGELQESAHHPGLQYADAPDLWQAPVSFEWDQWAAYVARFPGESSDLNGA